MKGTESERGRWKKKLKVKGSSSRDLYGLEPREDSINDNIKIELQLRLSSL